MDDHDRLDHHAEDAEDANPHEGDLLPAQREPSALDSGRSAKVAEILGRVFGDTMNPVVTGMMAFAGVVTGRPELAALAIPVGALAGAASEEAVRACQRAWMGGGVAQLKDCIEDESDEPMEEIMADLASDRKLSSLLGEAVHAAAQSSDGDHIRALAKAFIAGAKNPDMIDAMGMLIQALAGVQRTHVRVMAVLAQKPYLITVDDVAKADPTLRHTVALLCRDLERLGLVMFEEWNTVRLSAAGWSCAALLHELGSLQPDEPTAEPAVAPSVHVDDAQAG